MRRGGGWVCGGSSITLGDFRRMGAYIAVSYVPNLFSLAGLRERGGIGIEPALLHNYQEL